MTRLRLTRPHTHAGTTYGAGEPLDVDPATAAWLFEHNVAALDPKPDRKPAKPDPESNPLKEPKP